MHYFIHIDTGSAVIADTEGAEFPGLEEATAEAAQSARVLMAEELRRGNLVPLEWQVIVAHADGSILRSIPFADLVSHRLPAKDLMGHKTAVDAVLLERAAATFHTARRAHAGIHDGLRELREHLRRLGQLSSSLR